eukprot:CAMPEP_0183755526 /NCGR_PEP_ID=MMETSP0739-20130205/4323_1 /TAXON_ID=385413 /ORGANISM="Thalassiosira miniscula, Strain CCMP1093" /LENGTH=41 /DNA_ID= /DNA_START= /DNA_END= /DNA_ORIENTATION=
MAVTLSPSAAAEEEMMDEVVDSNMLWSVVGFFAATTVDSHV